MISDDSEKNLASRRRFALWHAPVGGFFVVDSFFICLGMFASHLGLALPGSERGSSGGSLLIGQVVLLSPSENWVEAPKEFVTCLRRFVLHSRREFRVSFSGEDSWFGQFAEHRRERRTAHPVERHLDDSVSCRTDDSDSFNCGQSISAS